MPHYQITNQTTGEKIRTDQLGDDYHTVSNGQLAAAELAFCLINQDLPEALRREFQKRGFQGYEKPTHQD